MEQVVVLETDRAFLRFQDKSRREPCPGYPLEASQLLVLWLFHKQPHPLFRAQHYTFNCTRSIKALPSPVSKQADVRKTSLPPGAAWVRGGRLRFFVPFLGCCGLGRLPAPHTASRLGLPFGSSGPRCPSVDGDCGASLFR